MSRCEAAEILRNKAYLDVRCNDEGWACLREAAPEEAGTIPRHAGQMGVFE